MNYLEIASEQLRRDEGVRKKPYRDQIGKVTIGIGRNLDDVGLSDDEVAFLFENDLDSAIGVARRLVPKFDLLSETRKAAIVNLAFNLGPVKLAGFHRFLEAVDAGDFPRAAAELRASIWHAQVGERAERIEEAIEKGGSP